MVSGMRAPGVGAGLYGARQRRRLLQLALPENLAAQEVEVAAVGREGEGDERLAALDLVVMVIDFRLLGFPEKLARRRVGAQVPDRVARPPAGAAGSIEESARIEQHDRLAVGPEGVADHVLHAHGFAVD